MSTRNRKSRFTGTNEPVIFGTRTRALMYLAIHPGCTSKDARSVLGWSLERWKQMTWDLRRMGVVCGHWYYSLNPNLENFVEFRAFLKALAAAHGMTPVNDRIGPTKAIKARHEAQRIPIPPKLIFGRARRDVLMALACLKESSASELANVVGRQQGDIRFILLDLAKEGFLRRRIVGIVHLYSFDPAAPAALELYTLLRRMSYDQGKARKIVMSVLLNREMAHAEAPFSSGKWAKQIAQPARYIAGTRRFKALAVRRAMVNVKGDRRFRNQRRLGKPKVSEPVSLAALRKPEHGVLSRGERREYVLGLRELYERAAEGQRGEMLDQIVAVTGYARQYAKLLLQGRSLS